MGNFSRDPAERLNDSVIKHYVGVHLQQGAPLVDANLNLLGDLGRRGQEAFGTWFIGNGVPSGSDGFHVVSVDQPNDFGIIEGVCLVNGKLVENSTTVRYTTQPNFGNTRLDEPLPTLTTPGGAKQFIVYLDVWEHEVDGEEDPALIDVRIGLEDAVTLKREWAVRVARVPEDLPRLQAPPPAGHLFYPLARLSRQNNAQITTPMIADLRDTQVSVQRKIEVRDNTGQIVVDNARFMTMLLNTRNNAHSFIKYILTQFNQVTTHMQAAELLGMQASEHIASTAEIGLSLLASSNLANSGALGLLSQLYYAENNFMVIWRDVVLQLGTTPKTYATYNNFITRLNDRLNQPNVGVLIGLQPALQGGNLEAATAMQEEIARLFGTTSTSVARGTVQVFLAQSPSGNLNSPPSARFVFKARSFTTKADTYTVRILPTDGWPRRVVDQNGVPIPENKISIGAAGSETSIFVDADVQPGTSDLQLRVTSDSNPEEINQLSNQFSLTQGQPAPVGEDRVQFHLAFNPADAGSAVLDLHTGVISIRRGTSGNVQLRIFNNTGANSVNFTVALEQQEKVGTWTVLFDGSVPSLANGQSAPLTAIVTPAADAVSMKLKITAKATINGAEVPGQVLIALQARSS
jgi:hypothetical protein